MSALKAGLKAFALTVASGTTLIAAAGQLSGQYAGRTTRPGWAPRQYLAITRALPAGHRLTASDVRVETAPEQFVSDTLVPVSDEVALPGRTLMVPVQARDVVVKALFVPRPVSLACGAAARTAAAELGLDQERSVVTYLLALDGALANQHGATRP
ncbi:MAG: hypothetical protein SFW67_25125 [Myxococcaceae bacterium]|nr:hypothetical protein [Myxococcaceae bacterium]